MIKLMIGNYTDFGTGSGALLYLAQWKLQFKIPFLLLTKIHLNKLSLLALKFCLWSIYGSSQTKSTLKIVRVS